MNKTYRVIWSHAQNAFIAASELAKVHGKSKKAAAAAVAAALISVAGTALAASACDPGDICINPGDNYTYNPADGTSLTFAPGAGSHSLTPFQWKGSVSQSSSSSLDVTVKEGLNLQLGSDFFASKASKINITMNNGALSYTQDADAFYPYTTINTSSVSNTVDTISINGSGGLLHLHAGRSNQWGNYNGRLEFAKDPAGNKSLNIVLLSMDPEDAAMDMENSDNHNYALPSIKMANDGAAIFAISSSSGSAVINSNWIKATTGTVTLSRLDMGPEGYINTIENKVAVYPKLVNATKGLTNTEILRDLPLYQTLTPDTHETPLGFLDGESNIDLFDGTATFTADIHLESKWGTAVDNVTPLKELLIQYSNIRDIKVNLGKFLPISGNGTSVGSRLFADKPDEGISGDGGIYVTGNLYLAGKNNYANLTKLADGALLNIEKAGTLAKTSGFEFGAGSTFVIASDTEKTFNTKHLLLRGDKNAVAYNDSLETLIHNAVFNLQGADAAVSFMPQLAEDAADSAEVKSAGNDDSVTDTDGRKKYPHHIAKLDNSEINLTNGAVLYLNSAGADKEGASDGTSAAQIAILEIGDKSKVTIQGKDTANSKISSHLYAGNGVLRVMNGGTLVLGENSGIHFAGHLDGFFEFDPEKSKDSDQHASIELADGASLALELDTQNHIYVDSLLKKGHKHYLIKQYEEKTSGTTDGTQTSATPGEETASGYWYGDGKKVTLKMTAGALSGIMQRIDKGKYNEEVLTASVLENLKKLQSDPEVQESLAKGMTIADLKTAAANAGIKGDGSKTDEEVFNEVLGAVITLGMYDELHNSWQKYSVFSAHKGAYISVDGAYQWADLTSLRLSLQNLTNESVARYTDNTEGSLGTTSGAYRTIMTAVNTFTSGGKDDFYSAARTIDSAGQLATVAGAQTIAWDMLQNRRDAYSRQRDRAQAEIPVGESQVWVEALSLRNNSDELWNDLNGDREVDTKLYGFMMGHDFRTSPDILWGASLSYLGGESDAELGSPLLPKTQNDIDSFAASVHGAWSFTETGRLAWDAALQYADNDIKMVFPGEMATLGSLTADAETWAVQVRAGYEQDFHFANAMVTPYASLQYTWLRTGSYTSKLAGLDAFHTEAVNQHIGSIPVGLKAKADFAVGETQVIRPWIDAYVQPNFGDTDRVERTLAGSPSHTAQAQ